MARPKFVQIPPHPLNRFEPLLGADYARVEVAAERARHLFAGRTIWHVSSALRGGGVAEMLSSLLPYARGAGIDTRWVVLRESAQFFELTKRLHNNLHGDRGDGGTLDNEQRDLYERTLATSARHLIPLLQKDDVVFLHDPQTAGLVRAVKAAGAKVIWRCHVGADHPNELSHRAWDFLAPHVHAADAYVFSRRAYVWDVLDRARAWVMPPSIDPFSPKNQELDSKTADQIVGAIGLGHRTSALVPTFTRADDTPARVERHAEIVQEERLPETASVVAQISRWDRLKDHRGLLTCFARHLVDRGLHLVLAGPATAALPMDDLDENAAMVNALQRRSDIVVQKSLAEGFGLTVAEAMWKRRPVVGTRVGGIQDQIVDGHSGLLVDDPHDLQALARAIVSLAEDRERAAAIGEQAHRHVFERFLIPNRLAEYVDLLAGLDVSSFP